MYYENRYNLFIIIIFLLASCQKSFSWSHSFQVPRQPSRFMEFENFLFGDSYLTLSVNCGRSTQIYNVMWHLIRFECLQTTFELPTTTLETYQVKCPNFDPQQNGWDGVTYQSYAGSFKCSDKKISLEDYSGKDVYSIRFQEGSHCESELTNSTSNKNEREINNRLYSSWGSGTYKFFLLILPTNSSADVYISGELELLGERGHLNKFLYWKYIIVCLMSVLYLLLSTLWLGVWTHAREYTSRIHVALGLVCIIACLSNILNAIDLSVINNTGRQSYFCYILGSISFIFYSFLVNVIFTAAGTGLRIIRTSLTTKHWITIIGICTVVMLLQLLEMFIPMGGSGIKESSFFQLVVPFKVRNVMFIMESSLSYILCCITVYFCSITFVYLYLRRHSSRGKFVAFSFFASSAVVIFLATFVSIVAMMTDKFSTCIYSELSASDWFNMDLFPQIKLILYLASSMFLWRPVDEYRSYGFQALMSKEEDVCVQYRSNGLPEDDLDVRIIYDKLLTETDNY